MSSWGLLAHRCNYFSSDEVGVIKRRKLMMHILIGVTFSNVRLCEYLWWLRLWRLRASCVIVLTSGSLVLAPANMGLSHEATGFNYTPIDIKFCKCPLCWFQYCVKPVESSLLNRSDLSKSPPHVQSCSIQVFYIFVAHQSYRSNMLNAAVFRQWQVDFVNMGSCCVLGLAHYDTMLGCVDDIEL